MHSYSILVKGRVVKLMLKCELKRFFSNKMNRMVLIAAFLLAIISSCFAIGTVRYVDENGVTHKGLTAAHSLAADRNKWKGTLTSEKLVKIMKNRKELAQKYSDDIPDAVYGKTIQSYDDISSFIVNVSTPDFEYDESALYRLTEKQTKNLYTTYENNIQKIIAEYGKTPQQKKFLEKQYEKITMPLYYEAKDSWDIMEMYAETYGIILAIIIGFLASGIFAEEFQTGAEAVFFSTKYGRTKATKNKIVTGLLMTTIVYWIGVGILTLISFGIMGLSGFRTPYQIDQPYSIYAMTYGQYYFLILVCGYIASLLAASVTMFVTAKMHTRNIAVGIPFFLYCLMPFIGRALSSFTTFFNLTPDLLFNIMGCVKNPIVFQIGTMVFRQVPMIMLIYTIVSIILLPFVYQSYCRYGLEK